ncbi:hypothetical protein [Soonwooa sp.]|uniref:hypothetical protein n=1 Tax=Soonwooa sp. TaxID=1938592 RepID=UPI002603A0AB|nr:hypothetical protein [Soonwooa sp.]
MRKQLYILALFCFTLQANAQTYSTNFNVNLENAEVSKVNEIWKANLKTNSKEYWDSSEIKNLKNFNILDMSGIINPSLMNWNFDNRVLSINPISENKYLIKSLFETENREIFAITNVIAKKTNDGIKLSNFIFEYTKDWKITETKNFKYIYPSTYNFSFERATEAEDFYINLCKTFEIKPEKLTYFIAENCDNIYDMIGYDYIFSKGTSEECGYFESKNNFIYATQKSGENHYHEITHFINEFYPNANELLLTGISAYISKDKAHFGKPLIYHTKRVNEYLKKNKEINLSKPFDFYSLDNATNPQYVIGAILCDLILEKGGKKLLINAFNNTKTDEDLIKFLDKNIITKNENLNQKIRKTIDQISNKNNFPNFLE